jgi:hypothetical protein
MVHLRGMHLKSSILPLFKSPWTILVVVAAVASHLDIEDV